MKNYPVRHLLTGVALATLTISSATGCSSDSKSGNASVADGPAVAWAGQVCDTMSKSGAKLAFPTLSADPKESKTVAVDYLGSLSTQLRTLSSSLKRQGRPPVTDGQAALDQALGKLADTSQSIDKAKERLMKAKVTDDKSLSLALSHIGVGISNYSTYAGPVKDLSANPALHAAFAKAPTCSGVAK